MHRHFVQFFVAVIGDGGSARIEEVQVGQLVGFVLRSGDRSRYRASGGQGDGTALTIGSDVIEADTQLRFVATICVFFGCVVGGVITVVIERGEVFFVHFLQCFVVCRVVDSRRVSVVFVATQWQSGVLAAGEIVAFRAVFFFVGRFGRGFCGDILRFVMRPADVWLAALRCRRGIIFRRGVTRWRTEWRRFVAVQIGHTAQAEGIVVLRRTRRYGLHYRRVRRACTTALFALVDEVQQSVAQVGEDSSSRGHRAAGTRVACFRVIGGGECAGTAGRIRRCNFARMEEVMDFAMYPVVEIDAPLPDGIEYFCPVQFREQGDADEEQQGVDAHHQLHRPHFQQFNGNFQPDHATAGDGKRVNFDVAMQRQDAAQRDDGNHQGKAFPDHQFGVNLCAAHALPADSCHAERQQISGITEQGKEQVCGISTERTEEMAGFLRFAGCTPTRVSVVITE